MVYLLYLVGVVLAAGSLPVGCGSAPEGYSDRAPVNGAVVEPPVVEVSAATEVASAGGLPERPCLEVGMDPPPTEPEIDDPAQGHVISSWAPSNSAESEGEANVVLVTPMAFTARDAGNEGDVRLRWAVESSNQLAFIIERQRWWGETWVASDMLVAPPFPYQYTDSAGAGLWRYRIAAAGEEASSAPSGWSEVRVASSWTTFEPSADTRIVYVSSSEGNDSNDGLSTFTPVRTLLRARDLVRNGYPDWILLKCGDTFNDYIRTAKGGRSATELMLYSSYGSGLRPVVIPPSNQAGVFVGSGNPGNIAIVGLHIKAGNAGNGNSGFNILCGAIPLSNVLIEDCYVEQFKDNMNIQGNSGGANRISNLVIRRSVIVGAFPPGSAHSQGAFIDYVDGLLIEECLIDHNGWAMADRSDATIFNHNLYLSSGNTGNTTIRNNIITRAASHGLQLRNGGVIEGNVFVQNPISMQLGGGDPAPNSHTSGVTGTIRDNIVLEGVDINGSNPRGQGIYCLNIGLGGAIVTGNIVANNTPANDINATPFYCQGSSYGSGVGYNNMSITGNIFYNWRGPVQFTSPFTTPPSPSSFSGISGNRFEDNDIQVPDSTGSGRAAMTLSFASSPAQMSFRNNSYSSNLPDGQRLRYSASAVTLQAWMTSTHDSGSAYAAISYVDPSRNLASYHGTIGGEASTDAFLMQARQQRNGAWRPEYAANAVAEYVRQGFARAP